MSVPTVNIYIGLRVPGISKWLFSVPYIQGGRELSELERGWKADFWVCSGMASDVLKL